MDGATHFIEEYSTNQGSRSMNKFTKKVGIEFLKKTLEDTIEVGCKTIAVWRIKPKTILITGEEINGQAVLIAEKI